jgi:hypothetical protein
MALKIVWRNPLPYLASSDSSCNKRQIQRPVQIGVITKHTRSNKTGDPGHPRFSESCFRVLGAARRPQDRGFWYLYYESLISIDTAADTRTLFPHTRRALKHRVKGVSTGRVSCHGAPRLQNVSSPTQQFTFREQPCTEVDP